MAVFTKGTTFLHRTLLTPPLQYTPLLEFAPILKYFISFWIGHCVFSSPQTGALFLAPHSGSRLALIISGNSIEGIRDAVHLATPTIPPMTRSPFSNMVPDYVITGPSFRARGPGGYLCAGFWDNRWGYEKVISSCVC